MIYLVILLLGILIGYVLRGNSEYIRGRLDEYEKNMDNIS